MPDLLHTLMTCPVDLRRVIGNPRRKSKSLNLLWGQSVWRNNGEGLTIRADLFNLPVYVAFGKIVLIYIQEKS